MSLNSIKNIMNKIIIIFLTFFVLSCSNILYNHYDTMSMLTKKQMVIDKFGEPTSITEKEDYDEYYYDFGVFEERVNYYDKKISTVIKSDSILRMQDRELMPQFRIKLTQKYIKFHINADDVIFWESQAVNFPTKKQ
tara:strand:+ start:1443 stop:1853 length:411 start_codon:yes stop_codon:yes gene_type:complete